MGLWFPSVYNQIDITSWESQRAWWDQKFLERPEAILCDGWVFRVFTEVQSHTYGCLEAWDTDCPYVFICGRPHACSTNHNFQGLCWWMACVLPDPIQWGDCSHGLWLEWAFWDHAAAMLPLPQFVSRLSPSWVRIWGPVWMGEAWWEDLIINFPKIHHDSGEKSGLNTRLVTKIFDMEMSPSLSHPSSHLSSGCLTLLRSRRMFIGSAVPYPTTLPLYCISVKPPGKVLHMGARVCYHGC